MTIALPVLTSTSQTGLLFNWQYQDRQYVSYCIPTWHDGRLMDSLYAHARFDDLDFHPPSTYRLRLSGSFHLADFPQSPPNIRVINSFRTDYKITREQDSNTHAGPGVQCIYEADLRYVRTFQ